MGKVLEQVQKHITNGNEIATVVATDYLITAGVSNWGGYGLAAAIYCALSCPVHERYRRKGVGLVKDVHLDDFLTTVKQVCFPIIAVKFKEGGLAMICHCLTQCSNNLPTLSSIVFRISLVLTFNSKPILPPYIKTNSKIVCLFCKQVEFLTTICVDNLCLVCTFGQWLLKYMVFY